MSAPYPITIEVVITIVPIFIVIVGGTWFLLLADRHRRQDQIGQPGHTGRTTPPPPAVWANGPTSFPPIPFDFQQNPTQGRSTAFTPHPWTPTPLPSFDDSWTGTRDGSSWTTAPGFVHLLDPADRPRQIGGSYRETTHDDDYPFGGSRPSPPRMEQPEFMPASDSSYIGGIRNLVRLFESWTLRTPPSPPAGHQERPPSPLQQGGRLPEVQQRGPIFWPRSPSPPVSSPPTPPPAPSPFTPLSPSLRSTAPADQMYASDSAASSGSSSPASPLRRVYSWTCDDDDHSALF